MIHISTKEEYKTQCQKAFDNPDEFWSEVASSFLWKKKWSSVQSGNFESLDIKWFDGAQLNITENCLDRHVELNPDKIAILWEPNEVNEPGVCWTYKELLEKVNQAANGYKSLGIKKGDRVCFYMSMVPEIIVAVLACARIGAVHSVVFGGFSAKSLSDRINDCQAKLVVTNDAGFRGSKIIPLKDIVDEALETSPSVITVLVNTRVGNEINWVDGRDQSWEDLVDSQSTVCPAELMSAEDPLFILYTSGSTGKPKGLVHTCAGYMVYAQYSFENVFQMKSDTDIFWCTADVGWITGHTYMAYGPLLAGVTQVVFEGVPTHPTPARFWETIDKHKVTHFYTAPTAIRALEACDIEFVKQSRLDSLKVLGSVGEPINEEAWQWYHKNIGKNKCPIVDTWWQTETGGIMISPLAGITDLKPCFAVNPLPGIQPELVDSSGQRILDNNQEGNLVISRPWPGMARTIYGDHERYRQTYFSTYPGYYFTGDGVKRDSDGCIRIIGRVDDVINVSGHRIGTAEVEDALNLHENIVESAVVGFPHEIKGQGIFAFCICTGKIKNEALLIESLKTKVSEEIGSFAKPERVIIVEALPKTRSGKIMRRILRKIASGDTTDFGDISTLLNPESVESILNRAHKK